MRQGEWFELALEANIPAAIQARVRERGEFQSVRYELRIGNIAGESQPGILHERLYLRVTDSVAIAELEAFPAARAIPQNIWAIEPTLKPSIIAKNAGDLDYYIVETSGGPGMGYHFKFGPFKSALANLPGDESKFPVSVWFRELLTSGVQKLVLNSQVIRNASPPARQTGFKPDGSNLPWVIERLSNTLPAKFQDWIRHVQTALPDLKSIRTVERPDDKHRYVMVDYNGVGEKHRYVMVDYNDVGEVPSFGWSRTEHCDCSH